MVRACSPRSLQIRYAASRMRPSRRASAMRGMRQPSESGARIISFTALNQQCINNGAQIVSTGPPAISKAWIARRGVMFRFQYGVITKASRARAWEIFSNWHRWNEFANIYGELHWREGRPWEAG